MSTIRAAWTLRALAVLIIASSAGRAGTIVTTDGNVTVTDVVTPISGGLFQYNYSVTDGTMQLAVLDIAVTVGVPISGLATPGSSLFTATIDTVGSGSSEQEFVSFLENNGVFSSTAEPGFIFDSPIGPSATTFGITLFDGTTGTGGGITAPIVTPEPSYLAVAALGLSALLFWRKRLLASRPR